ncbi:MAG: DNA polymerase III subunit epsilon [Pseudomonadota bacterium]|nr:DNA polymerase III subunit epsilon [Pseudomonadota bacterium]
MRQVFLDTETTGLAWQAGHRVIEIGCVEAINRRPTEKYFHSYIDPQRDIDDEAIEVHGITTEFLIGKPKFAEIAREFIEFIKGSELIIHNAPFDIAFLDNEIKLSDLVYGPIEDYCEISDSLALARRMHPGQRNSLDALAKRYQVDNSHRTHHGGLLDAQILADVYLSMTGGQTDLTFDSGGRSMLDQINVDADDNVSRGGFVVVCASEDELAEHEKWVELLGKECLWITKKS